MIMQREIVTCVVMIQDVSDDMMVTGVLAKVRSR